MPSKSTPLIALAVAKAVAVAALPVQEPEDPEAFPVKAPTNEVAVNAPVFELKVRLVAVFGGYDPLAAVVNRIEQEVSVDSAATVRLVTAVAVAALPVY